MNIYFSVYWFYFYLHSNKHHLCSSLSFLVSDHFWMNIRRWYSAQNIHSTIIVLIVNVFLIEDCSLSSFSSLKLGVQQIDAPPFVSAFSRLISFETVAAWVVRPVLPKHRWIAMDPPLFGTHSNPLRRFQSKWVIISSSESKEHSSPVYYLARLIQCNLETTIYN